MLHIYIGVRDVRIGDTPAAIIQSVKRTCSLSGARSLHLLTLRSRSILKEEFNTHRELSSILFCEKNVHVIRKEPLGLPHSVALVPEVASLNQKKTIDERF